MKTKNVLRNFSIAIAWSFGLFLSSCSMSSDMVEEDPRSPLVLHAQIQDLANKYGLNIEINDSALAANAATLDLKQMESDFKSLAQLKGRYEMNVDGNKMTLDTKKEKSLMKNLKSRSSLRSSVSSILEQQSGSYDEHCGKNGTSIYFTVNWEYQPQGRSTVRIGNDIVVNGANQYYDPEVQGLYYQFVGALITFDYGFTVKCKYSLSLTVEFRIDGHYSMGSGYAQIV